MRFALVNGQKVEATKGTKGQCPSCGADLIARCGELKVDHWAHKGNRNCDPWWENETEWHRSWKDHFPKAWQEVSHTDKATGEKHIADVKTQTGWTLEFQHSFLNSDERQSRIAFYPKLIWVVDGTRRKTDVSQFEKTLNESRVIADNPPIVIRQVHFPDECRLLREWHNSKSLVFFDFQDTKTEKQAMLWLLFPMLSNNEAYLSSFPRSQFIKLHNENQFDEVVRTVILPIHKALAERIQARRKSIQSGHPGRPSRFNRYRANSRRRQRRL